jgi:WD40 repeat protein
LKAEIVLQGTGVCWSLVFNPADVNELLVSMVGQTFRWHTQNEQTERVSDSESQCAAYSPGGDRLFLGGELWGGGGPGKLGKLTEKGFVDSGIAFNNSGTFGASFTSTGDDLLFIDKDALKRLQINGDSEPKKLMDFSVRAYSLDISPNDDCLIAASPSGEIMFIDFRTGEEIGTFRIEHPVRHVRFMNEGDRIVASTTDGKILYWDY